MTAVKLPEDKPAPERARKSNGNAREQEVSRDASPTVKRERDVRRFYSDGHGSETAPMPLRRQVRVSIIRIAIANSRKPTAPRQKPTGSSRNVWCANATMVPT